MGDPRRRLSGGILVLIFDLSSPEFLAAVAASHHQVKWPPAVIVAQDQWRSIFAREPFVSPVHHRNHTRVKLLALLGEAIFELRPMALIRRTKEDSLAKHC